MRRLVVSLALLLGAVRAADAQDEVQKRIQVRTTAVTVGAVDIDRGRLAGLEPGDRVLFYPLGEPTIEGRIASISDRAARVSLRDPSAALETGTRGEVLVPQARFAAEAEVAEGGEAEGAEGEPVHPPWEYEEDEEWSQDLPLLASVTAPEPKERDPFFLGRLYVTADYVDDREGTDRSDLFLRNGADLHYLNPFQRGGALHFNGEVNYRYTDVDGDRVEDEWRFRLDRLSYTWGGTRQDARRWEVGRFLQYEFPEFGILDGAEFGYRLAKGHRVGGSIGFLPEPRDDFETGQDLQAAGFYRYVAGEREQFSLGAGYQKTWHRGVSDRDLLVASLRYFPMNGWNAYATTWVDFYDSSDVFKSSGPELTQLIASTGYRWNGGHGTSVSFTRSRFPETLRNPISVVSPDELVNGVTDRIAWSGWTVLTKRLRFSGRLDSWQDEDQDGGGGDVRLDVNRLFSDSDHFATTLFQNDAQFNDVYGLRLNYGYLTGIGFWDLTWEIANFNQNDFVGDQEGLLQHRLRVNWDTNLSRKWNFSLFAESRFGDEQDSLSLGFYLQRSF